MYNVLIMRGDVLAALTRSYGHNHVVELRGKRNKQSIPQTYTNITYAINVAAAANFTEIPTVVSAAATAVSLLTVIHAH